MNQYIRETKMNSSSNRISSKRRTIIDSSLIPSWMNVNEASYFIRFALATYSWPYYLYMHNIRGFCDICCICSTTSSDYCSCCIRYKKSSSSVTTEPPSSSEKFKLLGDTRTRRNLRAFKFLSKIDECDLIYANFSNELFLSPFCVLVDHFKKTVIITIRGTLSMRFFLWQNY